MDPKLHVFRRKGNTCITRLSYIHVAQVIMNGLRKLMKPLVSRKRKKKEERKKERRKKRRKKDRKEERKTEKGRVCCCTLLQLLTRAQETRNRGTAQTPTQPTKPANGLRGSCHFMQKSKKKSQECPTPVIATVDNLNARLTLQYSTIQYDTIQLQLQKLSI